MTVTVVPVILDEVKTAISVPDELFHRAERLAQRLGRSRSAFYADALAAYVDALDDEDEVTAALDALYAEAGAAGARAAGAAAGRRLIDSGAWEW
jgi:predicted transcriptional regulator